MAGINVGGYSGDGGPATDAELNLPQGLAIDLSGNIFIAEHNNDVIRRVDNITGNISTYAGNHISGYSGDGGPASNAEIARPVGIITDGIGNIFFSDQSNVVIRKIDNTGKISTVAGNNAFGFGYSGDGGPATAAELNGSEGVGLDTKGNLFIGDNGNNVIREVTAVTIGIDELKSAKDITIYPNPSSGIINISLGGDGYSSIRIFDITGNQIYSQQLKETRKDLLIKINSESLRNGAYIIQIINQYGSISKRVVIER